MSARAPKPDWRQPGDYAWLVSYPRRAHAWEWLRRLPDYRGDWDRLAGGQPRSPGRWKLHNWVDPDINASLARPIWTRSADPSVISAFAVRGAKGDDTCDFARILQFCTIERGRGIQHLLISDGGRAIRLDIAGAFIFDCPVRLDYRLSGLGTLASPLAALGQFRFLMMSGRFAASPPSADRRSRRLLLLLRAFDAIAEGASQRDIAFTLLASGATGRWRSVVPSLRSQVQRLVRGARMVAAGGFWDLLGP